LKNFEQLTIDQKAEAIVKSTNSFLEAVIDGGIVSYDW